MEDLTLIENTMKDITNLTDGISFKIGAKKPTPYYIKDK